MAKPRRRAADPGAASSTTDGPATAGTPWRGLDPYQRFALLSNHFRTSEALADATGLSVASIRQIFRATVLDGKRSPTLESDRYAQAMRRARHRMTDQTRRALERIQRQGSPAPPVRTPASVIIPTERRYTIAQRDYTGTMRVRESKSAWVQYHVEFLSDSQIHAMLMELHSLFMDTGQFTSFRFDYLAEADAYADGKFRDDQLRTAQRQMEFIKISSMQYPMLEWPRSDDFADEVMRDWFELQQKGGSRILNLYFAYFSDIGESDGLQQSRKIFKQWQRSQKRGGNNGKKRGDGRTF